VSQLQNQNGFTMFFLLKIVHNRRDNNQSQQTCVSGFFTSVVNGLNSYETLLTITKNDLHFSAFLLIDILSGATVVIDRYDAHREL